MTIREAVTASPLYWPEGWERRTLHQRARFGETNPYRETQEVLHELEMMGVRHRDAIVSTNLRLRQDGIPYSSQRMPEDPGAAVWFSLEGEERVLACDAWDRIEHNLRAIAKHIYALRAQDRWGVGSLEQAFRGFAALPESASGRGWMDILDFKPQDMICREAIEARFKELARTRHPDSGAPIEQWHELAMARKQALEATP